MAKFKVYVSDYDYPDLSIEKRILEPIGAEVIGLQCKTGEGLAELAADADAILQQYAKIPRETIKNLKKCKAICRYGIGVDIVDVEAAYEYGMVVTNVPDYCIDEVADHNITLGLALIRRILIYDKSTKSGKWHWSESRGPIYRFRDMTWGLIGFGRIAQNLNFKLKGLGFKIQAYDPYISEDLMASMGVRKIELPNLYSTSDVIALLCPYTEETHYLISENALSKMKSSAILLNCSRGKLVENKALYKALIDGWIAGAGLDDIEEEPAKLENWTPEDNPLFTLDNCIITPHVAYVSEQSLQRCREVAATNAKAVLLGNVPPNIVRPK